jgi:hypothetical protein
MRIAAGLTSAAHMRRVRRAAESPPGSETGASSQTAQRRTVAS